MFRFFVANVLIAVVLAGVPKAEPRASVAEQQPQPSHNLEIAEQHVVSSGYGGEYVEHGSEHGPSEETKYASGAELTSLAHSSALQAKTAVQNQHTAGSQAAFGAKSSLANAAIGAAMTAQAALVGKQVIVQGLKKQLTEAQHQLQAEIGQYQQNQQAASAAQEAAHQAQATLNALSAASTSAQGSAQIASKVATSAAGAAASQHAMVVEAKQRVAHITEELHSALGELQETEAAAQKAIASAHVAQSNAAAAGAVAVSASQSSHSEGHEGGEAVYYH